MTIRTIVGRTWRTPLTDVAPRVVGRARLRRVNYRGLYHHEGIGGFEYYRTVGWLPVTSLQIRDHRRWETWMVDDPVHWDGMREAVEVLPSGRIVVAGLGLGLMLHHIAEQPRFTSVTVVERSADVISLIRPTLPEDERVQIVLGDFYDHIRVVPPWAYDGILWDLAVGKPHETISDMAMAQFLCRLMLPGVPLVQFGIRLDQGGQGGKGGRQQTVGA